MVTLYLMLTVGMTIFMGHALAGAPENSLYRMDTPAVLEPTAEIPEPSEDHSVQEAFRKAYRNAGSPRMAVLWNRTFSDRLREMESAFRLVQSTSSATRAETGSNSSKETGIEESAVNVEYRKDDARPLQPSMSEMTEFEFEAGYARPLLESGVKVIDRNAVMRLTHAKNVREDPSRTLDDRQFIETEALKSHADMVIKILIAPSAESKLGAVFRVSVLDIRTGEVKADFFNDAVFEGKEKWTAVRGGYVRVKQDSDINFEEMGKVLAVETMKKLLQIWN
ncbi:MAG: hypothetical protein OXB94_04725 [Nitrospira sp.]|nr:hypothetical protein [Nitrospira sp.]